MIERGEFIVVYGVNNIGKSYRVTDLGEEYKARGYRVHLLKYPIYNIEPTGPLLWEVLQNGKKMSSFQLQWTTARNRRDFEPKLSRLLDENDLVISEDYKWTGIIWGIVYGQPLWLMKLINYGQRQEGLAILLDGERLVTGSQKHRHERRADMWAKARRVHVETAQKNKWPIVWQAERQKGANEDLFAVVDDHLSRVHVSP